MGFETGELDLNVEGGVREWEEKLEEAEVITSSAVHAQTPFTQTTASRKAPALTWYWHGPPASHQLHQQPGPPPHLRLSHLARRLHLACRPQKNVDRLENTQLVGCAVIRSYALTRPQPTHDHFTLFSYTTDRYLSGLVAAARVSWPQWNQTSSHSWPSV